MHCLKSMKKAPSVYTSKTASSSPAPIKTDCAAPEEVCEATWTVQGTHAKRDAQNTLSMQPGKKIELVKVPLPFYWAPLFWTVYLFRIPGYLLNFQEHLHPQLKMFLK